MMNTASRSYSSFITQHSSFAVLIRHAVFEEEAADLDVGAAADGRVDEERADAGALACAAARLHVADGLAGRGAVEADADRVVRRARVAEDVLPRRQLQLAHAQGRLRQEEVRVLALGRVAGRNHHDARDEAAAAVDDARGGAELGLDVLLDD